MQKIKSFLAACAAGYNKIKNIIFYILIAGIIACGVFILFKAKEIKQRQAAVAAELPVVSVKQEAFEDTPLYTRLEQTGMGKREILSVISKLDEVMQTRKLRKQDSYMLFMDSDGAFKLLVVTRDLSRYYVANIGGLHLVAGIIDIEVSTRVRTANGTVNDSLFASMRSAGVEEPLVMTFTDIFSWNIDFNVETRNGDKYSVIWEEDYTAATNLVVAQRMLAAKYEGAVAGKNYAFYFDGDFFDENGKISKRMFLRSPISFKGVRITSRFTTARYHPILRIWRPHLGIDYAAPAGTPVQAVADGAVKFAGWENGFGNHVEIAHANNYISSYSHLKAYNVKTGEHVRQGKIVGYVGMTGLATGPHLDFRIRQNGKYMNFLGLHNRNAAVQEVAKDRLEDFKVLRDKYLKILDSTAAPQSVVVSAPENKTENIK